MMFTRDAKKSDQKDTADGFTLIEVLIAMAIFAIGILAVASMQIKAINGNTSAKIQTAETRLAAERMERLVGLPYDHEDLNQLNNPHQGVDDIYTIVWNVTDDDPIAGTKTIRLLVTGSNPNAKLVSLNFIKGRGF